VQPTGLTANITQATLTVTAKDVPNITYSGVPYSGSNGVTYSGFVNGEDTGVLTGLLDYKGGASEGAVNVGSYIIRPGGQTSNNYAISYFNGTLTIIPAVLSAFINSMPTKVYDGTTDATLTSGDYLLTGFASGESATVGQTVGKYNSSGVSTASSITANLSRTDFTPSNTSTLLSNYILPTIATGPASITAAPLTVTAKDVTKGYGAPDNLTYSVSGLVGGDTTSGVFSGALNRTPGESLGNYTVNSGNLAPNSNYAYNALTNFTPGSLQIVPLVEPWQPTTLFTQTGSTLPPTLPSQPAQLDGQQARPLTVYASNDGSSGEITQQWGSGNGPAVTILDGGVRMPDDRDDERKDRQ
jgi:hypothetical protein